MGLGEEALECPGVRCLILQSHRFWMRIWGSVSGRREGELGTRSPDLRPLLSLLAFNRAELKRGGLLQTQTSCWKEPTATTQQGWPPPWCGARDQGQPSPPALLQKHWPPWREVGEKGPFPCMSCTPFHLPISAFLQLLSGNPLPTAAATFPPGSRPHSPPRPPRPLLRPRGGGGAQ